MSTIPADWDSGHKLCAAAPPQKMLSKATAGAKKQDGGARTRTKRGEKREGLRSGKLENYGGRRRAQQIFVVQVTDVVFIQEPANGR